MYLDKQPPARSALVAHKPRNKMSAELNLDDVAAQCPQAQRELKELRDTLTAVSDALDYLRGMTPQQAAALSTATVVPGEIAEDAWKLRMVYYDKDGHPVMSREPEQDEVRAALAEPSAEPVGWIEGLHGAFRANPLYRWTGPETANWSVPLYAA